METLATAYDFDISFDSAANFLASTPSVIIITILILIFAFFQYFRRFKAKTNRISKELEKVNRLIEKIETPQDFFLKYEEIIQEIENQKLFNDVWESFAKNLIFPKRNSGKEIICTVYPSKYFNLKSFGFNDAVAARINSIPNTLTGFGILGTFVGLTAGIYLAQEGLTAGDTQEVTKSLGYLLGGASFAFVTSIVGLTTSLFFAWRKSKVLRYIEENFESLNNRLLKITIYKNSIQLSHNMVIAIEEQTLGFKTFGTELATNIAGAFENKVSDNLTPLLEILIEGVNNLSAKHSEVGTAAIEQASKSMNESILTQMGSQMDQLGNTFSSLFDTLEKSSEMLLKGQETINEQSGMIVKSFTEAVETSATNFNSLMDSTFEELAEQLQDCMDKSMQQASEQIINMAETLKNSLSKTNSMLEKFDNVCEKMDEYLDLQASSNNQVRGVIIELGNTGKIFSEAGQPLKQAISQLDETAEALSEVTENYQSSNEEVSKSIEGLIEHNNKMAYIWQQFEERFTDVDDDMKEVFHGLQEGLRAYTDLIRQFHEDLDKSVSTVTEKLSGAVSEFGTHIEELAEVTDRNDK